MPITDYYVTTDAMGSVMAVLDESGKVLERRSYDAFGAATYMLADGTVVPDSPTGVDIGFQGQLMDELTGMYQMGFRWYSPILGRWVSRDPIGLKVGVNVAAFVKNAPNRYVDIYGLWGTDAHRAILKDLFKSAYGTEDFTCSCCGKDGLGLSAISEMMAASSEVDSLSGQSRQYAYKHAMRASGQSIEEAKALYANYVNENVGIVKAFLSKWSSSSCPCQDPSFCADLRLALKSAGYAFHAVSDSHSPRHIGFQEWGGGTGFVDGALTGGVLAILIGATGGVAAVLVIGGGYIGSGAPGHGDWGSEGEEEYNELKPEEREAMSNALGQMLGGFLSALKKLCQR